MARHRKAPPKGLRTGPLVLALIVCVFASGSGMGYVWHRNRNEQLSREIRALNARIEVLKGKNLILDRQLDELRSPRALEAAIRRLNLGLVMPQPEQILRIPETRPGTALAAPHLMHMAAQPP